MKKFFCALIISSLLSTINTSFEAKNTLVVFVPEIPYGLIGADATLYYDQSLTNPRTTLPRGYFVSILEGYENAYEVSYLDIDGYMAKSDVSIVDFEPTSKFALSTLTPDNDDLPINVRKSPDHTQNNKFDCLLEPDKAFSYYGTVIGTALKPSSNKWYHIRFDLDGKTEYGYVYDEHVSAKAFSENEYDKVLVEQETDTPVTPPTIEPTALMTSILIIVLCIPAVLIMLMLFKKPNNDKNRRTPRHYD